MLVSLNTHYRMSALGMLVMLQYVKMQIFAFNVSCVCYEKVIGQCIYRFAVFRKVLRPVSSAVTQINILYTMRLHIFHL